MTNFAHHFTSHGGLFFHNLRFQTHTCSDWGQSHKVAKRKRQAVHWTYRNTVNTLAIFPMALILFLMTSFRAATGNKTNKNAIKKRRFFSLSKSKDNTEFQQCLKCPCCSVWKETKHFSWWQTRNSKCSIDRHSVKIDCICTLTDVPWSTLNTNAYSYNTQNNG